MANQNPQSDKKPQPEKPREPDTSKAAGDKKKWDIIDEQSWESFPGSDSPASWAGKDIAPQDREKKEKKSD